MVAKFRLVLIVFTFWLFVLFNLARPDLLLGLANFPLDLSSLVFAMSAGAALLVLLMPDLARMRLELMYGAILGVYLVLRLVVVGVDDLQPSRAVYLIVMESASLFVTVVIARLLSLAVTNFERAVENIVLKPSNIQILPMTEGEERINSELFRARRFDRPVSFIMIELSALDTTKGVPANRITLEAVFRKHYLQTRVGQIVEAALYKTDILTWNNDNLFVCLPETTYDEALKTAKDLSRTIYQRLQTRLPMGVVVFPDNGLIYSDLVEAAMRNTGLITEDEALTGVSGGGSKRATGSLPKLDVDGVLDGNTATPVGVEAVPVNVPPKNLPSTASLVPKGTPSSAGVATTEMPLPVAGNAGAAALPQPNAWRRLVESYRNLYELVPMPVVRPRKPSDDPNDPDFWVNTLPYQSADARAIYRVVKRAFDLSVIIGLAPFWFPVFLVVAAIIKLSDRGPIFFVQERTGRGGKRFKMYKFRSMVPDAPAKLRELAAQGLAKLDAKGNLAEPLKLKHDPRVTPIGRILRKTSLDELPQILNVLKGDMSLVGPRPTSWDLGSYTLMQTERLGVQPGITGLWQVYGRGNTDFNNWVLWDTLYIEKMSLTLDLKILIRTVTQVLKRRGAR